MFYTVEAVQTFPGTHKYDPNGEVVMATRSRRHGDVCRAIYHYLLAGHWVRVLNDNDQLVGGPFRPGAVLPVSFKAFVHSLERNEHSEIADSMPFQSQQTDAADKHSSQPSL